MRSTVKMAIKQTHKPAPVFELNIRRADGTVVSVTAESLALAVRKLEQESK